MVVVVAMAAVVASVVVVVDIMAVSMYVTAQEIYSNDRGASVYDVAVFTSCQ